jgi:hypothetical protein
MLDPNMDPEDQTIPAPSSPVTAAADLPEQAGPAIVEPGGPSSGGDTVAAAASAPAAGEADHEAAVESTGEDTTAGAPAARAPADDIGVPGADEESSVDTAATDEVVADIAGEADEPVLTDTVDTAAQGGTGDVVDVPPAEPDATEADETATGVADAGVAEVTDEPVAETAADAAADAVGSAGEAAPSADEGTLADEIGAADEDSGGSAEDVDAEDVDAEDVDAKDVDAEPAGSQLAVAEPVATATPQPRGVWTDEQAEAFRARLRDVTANVVDRAAGAVIETVNIIAAAVRSRTSSDRRRDPRG